MIIILNLVFKLVVLSCFKAVIYLVGSTIFSLILLLEWMSHLLPILHWGLHIISQLERLLWALLRTRQGNLIVFEHVKDHSFLQSLLIIIFLVHQSAYHWSIALIINLIWQLSFLDIICFESLLLMKLWIWGSTTSNYFRLIDLLKVVFIPNLPFTLVISFVISFKHTLIFLLVL